MLSEKNKILFVIDDDFKFYFQKLLCNDIESWACCKRSCKVCNNLKRKAIDDPFENPNKILHRELLKGDILVHGQQITQHDLKKMHITLDQIFISNCLTLFD
ncbi:Uncharacterized protein FWK35_00006063 [Aphis craccivora]|uniref:Uncharacterized protein n=1 Tax=Aphis craccivora TaxID=307492 RepID=A0A6G0YPP8_APHCR|nr:Uncharacterized protein FWK35_00006063 [Aphis craccivora]